MSLACLAASRALDKRNARNINAYGIIALAISWLRNGIGGGGITLNGWRRHQIATTMA